MRKLLLFFLLATAFACKKDGKSNKEVKASEPKFEAGSIAFDSADVEKFSDKGLMNFYRSQHFHTFWVDSTKRNTVIAAISKAESCGLQPEDYYFDKIKLYEKKYKSLSENEHLTYDFLLTQSLRKFMIHVSAGKLNPYHLYGNWDLHRYDFDVNKTIFDAVSGDSLQPAIDKIEPQHIVYKRLKKALAYLDTFGKDTLQPIMVSEKIQRGDSSIVVKRIKQRLMFWRDLPRTDSISPIYDRKAANAMKKFQLRHGLTPDGVIGTSTVTALNTTKIQRKQQVIANLERWRWFPHEMGNQYVIVNIPAYRLHVVKNNDTVDTRRVVVGKEKRRTPVLTSTFTDIILIRSGPFRPRLSRKISVPTPRKTRIISETGALRSTIQKVRSFPPQSGIRPNPTTIAMYRIRAMTIHSEM